MNREDELQNMKRQILHQLQSGDRTLGLEGAPMFESDEWLEQSSSMLRAMRHLLVDELDDQHRRSLAIDAIRLWALFSDELIRPAFEAIWNRVSNDYERLDGVGDRARLKFFLELSELTFPATHRALLPIPVLLPIAYYRELRESLEALEYGEVSSLLAAREGRERAFTARNLRLHAVQYIQWMYKQGTAKNVSEGRVRDAFGVGIATVRSWSKRDLKNAMGAEAFERAKDLAERAGTFARDDARDADRLTNRAIDHEVFELHERLSRHPIERWGAKYKKVMGFKT